MNHQNKEEIFFFGKITASVTHELSNVLAIIRESAGLMEDLLTFSKELPGPLTEKLGKSLGVVNRQLLRGMDLVSNLNRFAHSPDQSLEEIDLGRIVEQTTVLSRRFATLKKVTLNSQAPEQPVKIVSNLVQLQLVLFLAIECCLKCAVPGCQISLNPGQEASRVFIRIRYEENPGGEGSLAVSLPGTDLWKSLDQTMAGLKGSAEINADGSGVVLSLLTD